MDKNKIKILLREASEEKSDAQVSNSGQYEKIYSLLQNNIFNHAEIVEKLWGNKEASNRSLFRKKLNQLPNDSGEAYGFSSEELSKIASILMDTSSKINKGLGKKSPEEQKD